MYICNDIYSYMGKYIGQQGSIADGWYNVSAKVLYRDGVAYGLNEISIYKVLTEPSGYLGTINGSRQQSKRESCRDIDSGQAPISIWPNVGKNARVRGT